MTPDDLFSGSTSYRLEQRKVGVTMTQSMRYGVEPDPHVADALRHSLVAYVLSDHVVGDTYVASTTKRFTLPVTHEEPASWWQHFKRDHLQFIAKRWPVKTTSWTDEVTGTVPVEVTVQFDRYATYPEANYALPADRLGGPVMFEIATPTFNWETP